MHSSLGRELEVANYHHFHSIVSLLVGKSLDEDGGAGTTVKDLCVFCQGL